MSVLDVVGSYYGAWMAGMGDFSAVPLAPDFAFTGPVASFDTAEGFREMALPVAAMTSAEILTVRDGQIVRGELIYDAQELRAAMAAGA